MAIKKTDKIEKTGLEKKVEVEIPVDEKKPTVEVENPKTEETEKKVETTLEVDTSKAKIDEKKEPEANVKIRMREDHRCTIAMVRYDFKKGKLYTVPVNVKRILNNAGLLAPLN
jgi:hypothetical protein